MKEYRWMFLVSAVRAFLILPISAWNCKRRLAIPKYSSIASFSATENESVGIYVHIPFCRRRCRYCDFAIVPVGNEDRLGFSQLIDQYTTALLHEISNTTPKSSISSIYFGGGTPSLAPTATLQAILEKIFDHFDVAMDSEITIEMDPGTFDKEKIVALRDMGFNRISLGVQSFNDTILESLGRVHREHDVINALQILEAVWGDDDLNYSMDLISGLPGLSVAEWINTLERAVYTTPRPKHLSLYDLQVESVSCLYESIFVRYLPDLNLFFFRHTIGNRFWSMVQSIGSCIARVSSFTSFRRRLLVHVQVRVGLLALARIRAL